MLAQLRFFRGIIYNFDFSDKKIEISKILSMWVFVAPKCQESLKILQLVWTLKANKFGTKCFRCLLFAQTIVFHLYFMEITTFRSISLQVRQNHSSKLLKGYICYKSIFCNKVALDV